MIIANPLYDAVFKYLMEDVRIAKLIIATIIDEEIVDLTFRPQERTSFSHKFSIHLYRMDFAAKIKTKDGQYKNILIEIQKAKLSQDIMRFRKYLGEQYMKSDDIDGKQIALPIITIYFLGFKLKHITAQAIKINRHYIDAITGERLEQQDDFIEQLTHNSYVIQIPRLKPSHQTRLETLLAVFDQTGIQNDHYLLNLPESMPEEFAMISDRLAKAVMNQTLRDQLELEESVESLIEDKERAFLLQLESKDAEIQHKNKAIQDQEKTIESKDKTLKDKNKAIEEQEKTIESKDKTLKDKNKAIEDQEKTIESKDKTLKDKNKAIEDQEKTIEEKDKAIQANQTELDEKNQLIQRLQKQLQDKNIQ